MTPVERLQAALNGLGLKAVEARIESLLEQASKKEPSYTEFLDELLTCSFAIRRVGASRSVGEFEHGHHRQGHLFARGARGDLCKALTSV